MAEDHRVFDDEGADAAFDPVVYITAADTGVAYCDKDVVRTLDCGVGTLFEFYVVRFVEDEGEVLGGGVVS